MTLAEHAYTMLSDMRICRVLNGMWQVSGAHGTIDRAAALAAMQRYHDAGFTTWDLADHYGPAEDFIKLFYAQLAPDARSVARALTKWVPRPGPMPFAVVEHAVDIARRRMGVEALDMLQFHWWLYRDTEFLNALKHLMALRDAGKIRHIGLTNFDSRHLRLICAGGTHIVSNQVQYSILDRRPEQKMIEVCAEYNVQLLTYGTLAGGLLSERYLGQPEPNASALNTASLRKYKHMVDLWGGWRLFQELLRVLKHIAERHTTTVSAVAMRYILDKPYVAGVIAGARLGVADHYAENAGVFDLALDSTDLDAIHAVTVQAQDLMWAIGDSGDEYRR